MPIILKRVYEKPTPSDGYRVLVDRLWPRGISKDTARLDQWIKEAAPSDDLRRWFHEDSSRWSEFRKRYLSELKVHRAELQQLAQQSKRKHITLVYSASDEQHNNAVVVKQYLEMLCSH